MRKSTKNTRRKMRDKALKIYSSGDWRKRSKADWLMRKATKERWPYSKSNF